MRSSLRTIVLAGALGGALLFPLSSFLGPVLHAQQDTPPKVLVIQREFLKPGRGGMTHDRSEAAFVRAFSSGQPSIHYIAMDALSGPGRSLFLEGYDSLADWEKEQAALSANKQMAAAVDHAQRMDGDLLSAYDSAVMMYRPEMSLNMGHVKGTRFIEITTFVVKPGHRHEFADLAHMYAEAYRKASPNEHWDCFEVIYGNPVAGVPAGAVFVVFRLMRSLSEADASMQDSDKIASSMSSDDRKRAADLTSASIESESTNLFAINPRMSSPSPEWVKADPGFWTGPVSGPMPASSGMPCPMR